MRVLVLVLMLPLLGACSLTLGGTTLQGKDIIKGANTIKNISKITTAGVEESVKTKTKGILDPARGGGLKW